MTQTLNPDAHPTTDTAETTDAPALRVVAVDADRLRTMRVQRHDEHGNPWASYCAEGWEPLRCCLRLASPDESIVLISYAPFLVRSPWTEVGPVYVHGEDCGGYLTTTELPPDLRTGPRVLRGYDRDRALLYDHVDVVEPGVDIAETVQGLLAEDAVAMVHVRALATQCFTYAVQRTDHPV